METPNNLNQMQHLKELSENITKSYADMFERTHAISKAIHDNTVFEAIQNIAKTYTDMFERTHAVSRAIYDNAIFEDIQNIASAYRKNNFIVETIQYPYDVNISKCIFTVLDNPTLYDEFQTEIEPDIVKISKLSNKEKEDLVIDLDKFIEQQSDIPENVLRDTPEGKKLCIILAVLSGFCEAFDKFPPEIQPVLQVFLASLLALLAYYGFVLLNKI